MLDSILDGSTTFGTLPNRLRTIPGLWLRAVGNFDSRIFLSWQGKSWSYTEVHEDVIRWSKTLKGLGATSGSGIAIFMGNRPEYVSLLGQTWGS
jgi:long-subunit acyl-CoA synthetase (AMP-forming)